MLERIIDMAARRARHRSGRDPAAQLPAARRVPVHDGHAAPTYDSGDYDAALTEALRVAGYDELRAEQAERRARGDRVAARHRRQRVRRDHRGRRRRASSPRSRCTTTARATIRVGTSAHGQGHATSFAMIVADRLGIPIEQIALRAVRHRARSRRGGGTGGSRSLQLGGSRGARTRPRRCSRRRASSRRRLLEADARRHRRDGRRPRRRRRRARERAHVGRARAERPTTASARGRVRLRARPARRSRSARTSRSSRSTSTPDGSRRSATSRSTTAAASSTR